jgi:N-acetylglutamate synthase-like GNAT family acetyltransferase
LVCFLFKFKRILNKVNLRKATEKDKNALLKIINEAYKIAEFFKLEDRLNEQELGNYFASGTFMVLENAEELLGCVFYKTENDNLNFSLLSIAPEKQGKGYSKLLVREMDEIARENNCKTISIQVVNLRKPLFPFYESMGFVRVGTKPFPKPTRVPCHLVNMVKRVS